MRRISVAFANLIDPGWMAGGQYLFNLLYALKMFAPQIERVLRILPGTPATSYKMLDGLVERVFEFPPYLPAWAAKLPKRVTSPVIPYLYREDTALRQNQIEAQFMTIEPGTARQIPSATWLPDFQHLHYPELFSQEDLDFRARAYPAAARKSCRIVLSSQNALEDFRQVVPNLIAKASILPFVAQIGSESYEDKPQMVVEHYRLPEKFFFLPNQFWQHKNHRLVIQALALACQENPSISVVCSGGVHDHRNPQYFDSILSDVATMGLHSNVRILGRIPRRDFYRLMRQSLAVLQPSLFEGWSTTVEEAKSLGKTVILSGIPVHREQNPPAGVFFDPQKPAELAQRLLELFEQKEAGPDFEMEKLARQSLPERTRTFAETFLNLIQEMVNG